MFLPREIFLDTSFVAEALLPSQRQHACYRDFLRLAVEASTVLFFSRHLVIELLEAAFVTDLKQREPRRWRALRHDGRTRRACTRVMSDVRRSWIELLESARWTCIEVGEIADTVPELMSRFGLSSYDAVHIATARYAGVRALATRDTAFAKLPASMFDVYTDRTRVAGGRRYRGGATRSSTR